MNTEHLKKVLQNVSPEVDAESSRIAKEITAATYAEVPLTPSSPVASDPHGIQAACDAMGQASREGRIDAAETGTPRTDDAQLRNGALSNLRQREDKAFDFARTLERDLAQAKSEVERVKELVGAEWSSDAADKLLTNVEELQSSLATARAQLAEAHTEIGIVRTGLAARRKDNDSLRSRLAEVEMEKNTVEVSLEALISEREQFIVYCQSLKLATGEVGPIQVARSHIEKLKTELEARNAKLEEIARALESHGPLIDGDNCEVLTAEGVRSQQPQGGGKEV